MKQVVESMKLKLKAAEDRRESTKLEVESICGNLNNQNTDVVVEIAQHKIEELVMCFYQEAKQKLSELQKELERVTLKNNASLEREESSKYVHESLSEIVNAYCKLLRDGLVKNKLKIDILSVHSDSAQHLEDLVTLKIDKSVKHDQPEQSVLMKMAQDISNSYTTLHTYSQKMMDSVLYLKVSVGY